MISILYLNLIQSFSFLLPFIHTFIHDVMIRPFRFNSLPLPLPSQFNRQNIQPLGLGERVAPRFDTAGLIQMTVMSMLIMIAV